MNKIICTIFFALVFHVKSHTQTIETIVDLHITQICNCITKDTTIRSLNDVQRCMSSLDTISIKKSFSNIDTTILKNDLKKIGAYNPAATIEDNQGYYFGYLLSKKLAIFCPKVIMLIEKEMGKN